MKIQLFLFVLFIKTLNLLGQKIDFSKDWLNQLEHPKYDIYVLKPDNYIDKYKTYNFSNLIIPKTLFIGYIGDRRGANMDNHTLGGRDRWPAPTDGWRYPTIVAVP